MVLAAWCVLAAGIPAGIVYWAACLLLFGAQWLWVVNDPGWAPWSAGVTFAAFGAGLIRHQLVLVERLRVAQAGLAERSRAEERNRIARELHDVIAHSLTVSLLHVSSARLAVEHDPADAARALAEAERLGRQSLAEVRATVGLLRPADEAGIAPPVPGLDQVPRLVEQLRETGADVSLTPGRRRQRAAGDHGSAVYRIVQEALTNATRHAPGAAVTVRIAAAAGQVDVSVDSGGPPGHGSGMGLTSMRERAQAVGGTCTAGPGGSGWLVARLSLPASAPREPSRVSGERREHDPRPARRRPGPRPRRPARHPARAVRLRRSSGECADGTEVRAAVAADPAGRRAHGRADAAARRRRRHPHRCAPSGPTCRCSR